MSVNYLQLPQPKQRNRLRLLLGRQYYIYKRRWEWQFSGTKFAVPNGADPLPVTVFAHQSFLLRQLKDVEMWLQHNKVTNLRLAIDCINRIIIHPKEVFSFWYLVGNPTQRRGFKLGMTLNNGQVKSGYGGGLCQLTNLIYWMALHSPLTVKERWRHSYDVFPDLNRSLPFGSGATVAYNYIDLQLENNTNQAFQLCLWLTDTDLCGEIRSDMECPYSYEVLEKNHQITGPVAGQYMRHNQIFRRKRHLLTNEIFPDEFLTENHALMMYSPLLSPGDELSPSIEHTQTTKPTN